MISMSSGCGTPPAEDALAVAETGWLPKPNHRGTVVVSVTSIALHPPLEVPEGGSAVPAGQAGPTAQLIPMELKHSSCVVVVTPGRLTSELYPSAAWFVPLHASRAWLAL